MDEKLDVVRLGTASQETKFRYTSGCFPDNHPPASNIPECEYFEDLDEEKAL